MGRPGSDIPDRLVDAAREHFLAQGVDGASLRAIARDADTSIGMIYYHFKTKDDLFLAVVEHIYSGLLVDLKAALDPTLPVHTRIDQFFERFGRLSAEEAATISLIVREALVSSDRLSQVLERFKRGHIPLMIQLVGDGLGSGALKPHPPFATLVAWASTALLTQVICRRLSSTTLPVAIMQPEELARTMSQILLHGIASEADD